MTFVAEQYQSVLQFGSLIALALLYQLRNKSRKKSVAIVGLTCLDIHAWPVNQIPEKGNVSFIDQISISLAGTAGGVAVTCAKLGKIN